MDALQDSEWDLEYYSRIIEEADSTDVFLNESPSVGVRIDASVADVITQENTFKQRDCDEPSLGQRSKASREKMRRDTINERFSELSILLDPGRPAKTDKSVILSEAICVLNKLKAKAQDLKEANVKLGEDIKSLKEEKHELREEKSLLKAEKDRIEDHVKAMSVIPAGYVQQHPAAYLPSVSKMITFPSYGAFPMWQWMPPAARDISKDHELRPPMA